MLLESFFNTTIIDNPVSVKGIVKATLSILSMEIVVSPTMASTFYNHHCKLSFTQIASKFTMVIIHIKYICHVYLYTNLFIHQIENTIISSIKGYILVGHWIGQILHQHIKNIDAVTCNNKTDVCWAVGNLHELIVS
jgi:hypothetical protein